MKFKFRADGEDLFIFSMFAIFLLYIVAIVVANVHTFAVDSQLSGINPFPAFSAECIKSTIVFYILALIGLFASVKSWFIEREEGFGLEMNKSSKGYSRWAKDKEIKKELSRVEIKQVNSKEAGVPILINSEEMWVDNGEYHSLVIGATGSGKTQTVILPMVYSLAKAKESMIITDPKGEIYEKTSNMLRSRGYQILLLNFRDPQNGNAWNPMSLPYQIYKSGNQDKAIELLDDLALNILYDDSNKNADPFWEKTSADYFSGVALGLFEDAKPEEININSISLATTVGEEKFGGSTYIKEYFAGKDPASAAAINASSTIMAPSETKGSILSVFKQKVKLFASRENLSEMLSHSDINLESIGERPTAVFIVIQDEKKTYHSLVTILLKQIYETLISVAQRHGGQLPVRTNFLLDEFANMPPLKDVTTMITAARSRKIRFTMIIQNFAQLDDVYGKEDAETIRGNCGNIIYLITTELKALEEISKLCGEVKSKKDDKTASTPLVTVSDLQRMKQFEVIILRMRLQPFKTKFTPFFKINWGRKYPPAKYPTRPKKEVHTFDIKEFVKNQKKKKLLEMMNSADDGDNKGGMSLPGMGSFPGLPGMPSMPGMPGMPSMPGMRKEPERMSMPVKPSNPNNTSKSDYDIPDFLTRRVNNNEKSNTIPDFESFKNEMESNSFNPFDSVNINSNNNINNSTDNNSSKLSNNNNNDFDDDLGFDVDELVKKIDAKIAELEAEEKKQNEMSENTNPISSGDNTDNNTVSSVPNEHDEISKSVDKSEEKIEENVPNNSIESIYNTNNNQEKSKPVPNINLDDVDDDDDFFDDFFDN